jgi:hypothetical protein
MSNLVKAMVMGILVHFPWQHPLHHLPQLEAVLQRNLVTHKLQLGLKVLIVSIVGIGATAAFQLLHNSFPTKKKKSKIVLKSKLRFLVSKEKLILIQCFIVRYMYIKWSLEKLLMSLRCHVKLRW